MKLSKMLLAPWLLYRDFERKRQEYIVLLRKRGWMPKVKRATLEAYEREHGSLRHNWDKSGVPKWVQDKLLADVEE